MIAAHYRRCLPGGARRRRRARRSRREAQEMLTRAGERAASLAANDEAQHYFERAAELSDDPLVEAQLHERAGRLRGPRAGPRRRRTHFERALELYEAQGLTHPAARVSARLGEVEWRTGQARRGARAHGAGVQGALRRRAGRRPGDARRRAGPAPLLQRRARARRASGSTRRSRSPSRSGCPTSSRMR